MNKLERLQEAYPGFFGFMNWSPVGMEPFRELVRTELSLRSGHIVLDFGCGRGAFTTLFNIQGYLGIDANPILVAYAHKCHPSHAYAVMNGTILGLRDARFDAAVIIGVLHHLEDKSAFVVLGEIRRVLKHGGKVLVIEPVPVVSRWNILGRVIKSLDLGRFIRQYEAWYSLVSSLFSLEKCYKYRIGFNDLVILLGTR